MTGFDRLFKTITKPWVAISLGTFIIISFFYFDKPVAYFFHKLDLKQHYSVVYWITNLGIGAVDLTLLFLFALFFRYIHRNKQSEARSWFLFLCVLIPNLICVVLKTLLGRARPELLFDKSLYGFYGLHTNSQFWSLPSGHTTTVMGLFLGLGILFPRYFLACMVAALVIIATRVLLADHYLSDVVTTACLTVIEIGILRAIIRKRVNQFNLICS